MSPGPADRAPGPLVTDPLGPDPVAVIEVGSGSVKLLVTDADSLAPGRTDPVRWAIKTGLWSDGARLLDPEGLAATAAAFERFVEVVERVAVARVAVVGTAVARQVTDVAPLDRLSRDAFGVGLEVLSGAREAELGHAGATAGRDLPGPLSLIDIGSGSTELATAVGAVVAGCSLPVGARVLTDAYLHGDPPGPDELSSALSVAELHFDDLRRELPELAPALAGGTLIGVGAVAQIAAVEIGLIDPHAPLDGHVMTKPQVEEVFRALATESADDRAHNPGLLPDHVDEIVGALCILVEFMRRLDVADLVVSERNLRHGRAAELLATA